jgi:hypothetical protein
MQSWAEIMGSDKARTSIEKVHACQQNCWMVTTARTAMRSRVIPQAPKWAPLLWVLKNKLKTALGRPICFDEYIDYKNVQPSPQVQRISFLEGTHKRTLVHGRETPDQRYPLKDFQNV